MSELIRHPSNLPLPFSAAVQTGQTLFLSGQLGMNEQGKLVEGGIAAETEQTLRNIAVTLDELGSSAQHLVRMEIFLVDMADFAAMNKAYAAFFNGEHLPARTTVAVTGLALNARIEIQATALMAN